MTGTRWRTRRTLSNQRNVAQARRTAQPAWFVMSIAGAPKSACGVGLFSNRRVPSSISRRHLDDGDHRAGHRRVGIGDCRRASPCARSGVLTGLTDGLGDLVVCPSFGVAFDGGAASWCAMGAAVCACVAGHAGRPRVGPIRRLRRTVAPDDAVRKFGTRYSCVPISKSAPPLLRVAAQERCAASRRVDRQGRRSKSPQARASRARAVHVRPGVARHRPRRRLGGEWTRSGAELAEWTRAANFECAAAHVAPVGTGVSTQPRGDRSHATATKPGPSSAASRPALHT